MNARYALSDSIGIVILDNPPANRLGLATRRELFAGIERARRDPGVMAIVIAGAGPCFCAGADVREYNTSDIARAPTLRALTEFIELSPKPVVAALHGAALGAGLEVALAAHYRIASPGTEVGLSAAELGTPPDAGCARWLRRAVRLKEALNMSPCESKVKVEQLIHTGLLDRLLDGNLLNGATALAREVAARVTAQTSSLRVKPLTV